MSAIIKFDCPACRKRLKVNRQLLGKRMQCNRCNDIFYLKKVSQQEFLKYHAERAAESDSVELLEFSDSEVFVPVAETVAKSKSDTKRQSKPSATDPEKVGPEIVDADLAD